MKIKLLLFFISVLFSCSDKQVVDFGHEERYHLDKDEIALPLNKIVVDESAIFNEGLNINLPLNKYIKSKNYNVAIHIAIDDNINKSIEALKTDTSSKNISYKKNKHYHVYHQNKNQYYLIRILYEEKSYNNPILISIYSKDALLIQKKYADNTFINKILH